MAEPQERELLPTLGVSVEGPGPGTLADLWSILNDLSYVAEACSRVAATTEGSEPGDGFVCRALWQSAVVTYGRCFTSGRGYVRPGASRTKIPEDFRDTLEPGERLIHDSILEERNQHVGHRVGDQEQAKVILLLTPPPDDRAVEAVTVFGIHLMSREGDDLATFRRVVAKLGARLAAEYHALQQHLLTGAAQRVDEWYEKAVPLDGGFSPTTPPPPVAASDLGAGGEGQGGP